MIHFQPLRVFTMSLIISVPATRISLCAISIRYAIVALHSFCKDPALELTNVFSPDSIQLTGSLWQIAMALGWESEGLVFETPLLQTTFDLGLPKK